MINNLVQNDVSVLYGCLKWNDSAEQSALRAKFVYIMNSLDSLFILLFSQAHALQIQEYQLIFFSFWIHNDNYLHNAHKPIIFIY